MQSGAVKQIFVDGEVQIQRRLFREITD